jgi:hypothetical protein
VRKLPPQEYFTESGQANLHESRAWLAKHRDITQMYGPPPNCKRFEVERSNSLRKCIRPLSGESLSRHSMMIRACRSFKMPRSLRTHLSDQVFRHAVGLFFRLVLSSADLGKNVV